jgi:hypothetical protein
MGKQLAFADLSRRERQVLDVLSGWTGDVCHEDVQKAIQLAIWYDRHERDDAKRDRYVKLISNAAK